VEVRGNLHWPSSQIWPLGQLVALQTQSPRPLQSGVLPPHVEVQVLLMQVRHSRSSQVPQSSLPPQSSDGLPQVAPSASQVVGVQQPF
jgi:hypothetical protein